MCRKPIFFAFTVTCLHLFVEGYFDFAIPCITPNQEEAYCVSIFSCPPLMKALGSLDKYSIDFVKKSVCCGCSPGDMNVCCGTDSNFLDRIDKTSPRTTVHQLQKSSIPPPTTKLTTKRPTQQATKPHTTSKRPVSQQTISLQIQLQPSTAKPQEYITREEKRQLLPSRRYCGYQHTDDRPYEDNSTALDEFPWLAHVIFIPDEEEDTEQYLDRCNGILINNRYVLTSDYCAIYAPKVRLGQYNTNKTVTCIENPETPECTDPWIDVDVEEEIHRLDIELERAKIMYDFALLRLNRTVNFSDFIRPVCLPLEESTRPSSNQSFHFSGWGALSQRMIEKKRLIYKLTSVEDCYKVDEDDLKAAAVNISLMCLTPQAPNGELACSGDQAGPLMYSHRHQWFAEAIIMNVYHDGGDGAQRCSNTHPINAARITPEIIDWILDNIRR